MIIEGVFSSPPWFYLSYPLPYLIHYPHSPSNPDKSPIKEKLGFGHYVSWESDLLRRRGGGGGGGGRKH